MSAIADGEWQVIRIVVQQGQLTGGPWFADDVERRIGRRIEFRGRGRPRKPRQ